MSIDKRTRKFIKGIDSAKATAASEGIELTADEAAKLALKRALSSKNRGSSKKKKKIRGGWPFLPGSFESSSR